MQVKDFMSPDAVTVSPQSSVAAAARLLSRHNVGVLPVCGENRRLEGVITDRDIVLRCVAAGQDAGETPVEQVMSRGCVTVAPDADCAAASAEMGRHQIRRLPVVEGGRLVGMLSLGDLAKSKRFDMEAAEALSEISENVIRPKKNSG